MRQYTANFSGRQGALAEFGEFNWVQGYVSAHAEAMADQSRRFVIDSRLLPITNAKIAVRTSCLYHPGQLVEATAVDLWRAILAQQVGR